eukprot:194695-Pleurochrysis_carterae.AAC.4
MLCTESGSAAALPLRMYVSRKAMRQEQHIFLATFCKSDDAASLPQQFKTGLGQRSGAAVFRISSRRERHFLGKLKRGGGWLLRAWFHPPIRRRCSRVSICSARPSSELAYDACHSRFEAAVASGDLRAISYASLTDSSSGSSASRVTRPSFRASRASKTRPVMVSSIATSFGTSSGSVTLALMSGIRPHLASITENLQSCEETRRSAPRAIWKPPPRQTPCTDAMTGAGMSRHRYPTSCARLEALPSGRCSSSSMLARA